MIEALVWIPDERRLVSGTNGGGLALWNISEDRGEDGEVGAAIAAIPDAHSADVSAVEISPDVRWIASASKDKTVKIWRGDGTLVQTLEGHVAGVDAIAFSPERTTQQGTQLASVSVDSSLKLWQIGELPPEQSPLLRSMMGHTGQINAVMFSPDGTEIATAGSDRKVIVWKIEEILQLNELDYACAQVGDYFRQGPVVDDAVRSLCD